MKKLTAVALAAVAAEYAYARRMGRRWGATDDEVYGSLPGDELVPHPMAESTHAITIAAPPEDVWPWLVQMGYGRGGWYTDSGWELDVDLLRFLRATPPEARAEAHRQKTADRIIPELQHLSTGDVIPDGPPGTAYFTVDVLEPNRVLGLRSTTHLSYILPNALTRRFPQIRTSGEFSWVFILSEVAPDTTRLIVRTRGTAYPAAFRALGIEGFFLAEAVITPRMLRNIKRHVEGAARGAETQPPLPVPVGTAGAAEA